ncbi:MAG: hypothetical protein ABI651_11190 [Verrucomicrobiota bacterium]
MPAARESDRDSDEQLYALALYVYSLKPPHNPNLPKTLEQKALVARGEKVFRDSDNGCAKCHTPPLYTNNGLLPVEGFAVPAGHPEESDIMDRKRIDTDPNLTLKTRRGKRGLGRGGALMSLNCPSPRSSPHSFVVGRGRKFARAAKTCTDSSTKKEELAAPPSVHPAGE